MRDGDFGVEVLKGFGRNKPGDVIFPPGVLREKLMKIGLVKARKERSLLKDVFTLNRAAQAPVKKAK